MARRISAILILLLCTFALFADAAFVKSDLYPTEQSFAYENQLGVKASTELPANAALRAVGAPKYPVRPGDVFQLTYSDGSKPITETVQIDSNYNVTISNIGTMSAKGMTYLTFKDSVETKVKTFYPYAKPSLTLQSCGVFSVNVAGEVFNSKEVTVWGLSRLSDLASYATEYASTRDVRITYENGETLTYDLYAALRFGQDAQNPYLEPGCTVTFTKAQITVSLSGAVKRPGVYQPQESDTLEYLINNFGTGLTNKADSSSYMVTRYVDGQLIMNNVPVSEAADYKLQFGDSVFVAEKINSLPSVTVQGAVTGGKIYYQFFEGETVSQMSEKLAKSLDKDADIENLFVTRNGQLLTENSVIAEGDIVTVPFINQYVTVIGAVRSPGKFAYMPDKDISYYILQAGGYDTNARKTSVKIFSQDGGTLSAIEPNSIINVNYKTMTYSTAIGLIATTLSVVLSGISIYSALSK